MRILDGGAKPMATRTRRSSGSVGALGTLRHMFGTHAAAKKERRDQINGRRRSGGGDKGIEPDGMMITFTLSHVALQ